MAAKVKSPLAAVRAAFATKADERPWRTYVPSLAPVVEAELGRGNSVVSGWRRIGIRNPHDAVHDELELRFPIDDAAVRAEFELPPGVWATDGRAGSVPEYAVLKGSHPPTAERAAALEKWWSDWNAAPRDPIPLPPSRSS